MFVDLSAMHKKETRELSNSMLSEELETYIQRRTEHTDVIKTERKRNNLNATGSCRINIKENHNSLDTGLKLNVRRLKYVRLTLPRGKAVRKTKAVAGKRKKQIPIQRVNDRILK